MYYFEEVLRKEYALIPLMELSKYIAGGKLTGKRKSVLEIYMYREEVCKKLELLNLNLWNPNIEKDWNSHIIADQINNTASTKGSICGIILGITPGGQVFLSGSSEAQNITLYNVPHGFNTAILRSRINLIDYSDPNTGIMNKSAKGTINILKHILKA